MLRRRFLKLAGGAGGCCSAVARPACPRGSGDRRRRRHHRRRVFRRARRLARLKSMAPDLDVLLIDRNEDFLIGPLVLDYVFGRLETPIRSSSAMTGCASAAPQVRRADVFSIDPHNGAVETSAGRIPFTAWC